MPSLQQSSQMKNVMFVGSIKYIRSKKLDIKKRWKNVFKITKLTDLGQSIWYDYMERRILDKR